MLVRGQSLAESMAEYLIKEITSTPNIAVRHNAVVTGGTGTCSLESLTIQDQASGVTETVPAAALDFDGRCGPFPGDENGGAHVAR